MLALLSLSLSLVPDEKKCAVPPAVARAHQPELRDGGYTAQYQCIHGYQIVDSDKATKARSEEHTSELQSRPHISYAVFCLKKKKKTKMTNHTILHRNISHIFI